jgi:hypothetical protein
MKTLIITYNDSSKEEFKSKSLEKAEGIIRRRNAVAILRATYNGISIDLEPFKKIYGKPKTFLAKWGFNIFKIQQNYSKRLRGE